MCRRIGFLTLVVASLLVLPAISRADSFTYEFTSSVGHFAFTEPTLITSNQTLSIVPFKLQGATFVYASAFFLTENGQNEICFLFATSNVSGDCNSASYTPPYSIFGMEFLAPTSVGTFTSFAVSCAHTPVLGEPCIFPAGGWSLTISQGSPVPEPSSLVLFGSGALTVLAVMHKKLRGLDPLLLRFCAVPFGWLFCLSGRCQ